MCTVDLIVRVLRVIVFIAARGRPIFTTFIMLSDIDLILIADITLKALVKAGHRMRVRLQHDYHFFLFLGWRTTEVGCLWRWLILILCLRLLRLLLLLLWLGLFREQVHKAGLKTTPRRFACLFGCIRGPSCRTNSTRGHLTRRIVCGIRCACRIGFSTHSGSRSSTFLFCRTLVFLLRKEF